MLKSMTGYGQARQNIDGFTISVEVRGLNHRFLECTCRVPRAYAYLEEKIRSLVHSSVGRGKVEITLSILEDPDRVRPVRVNMGLAKGYLAAIQELETGLQLGDDIALSDLLRLPDLLQLESSPSLSESHMWQAVKLVTAAALSDFNLMREAEGETLSSDIFGRLEQLKATCTLVEEQSPKTTELYRERLFLKLKEVLAEEDVEERRVLQEAAIFADKTAVDEETVRLKSHIEQVHQLFDQREPVGRKMDFLVQEMNREINTIGSKAQDREIIRMVIDMKAEVEKIREQVQNIE